MTRSADLRSREQKAADRKAAQARIAAAMRETRSIVLAGKCPKCGSALRRNNALAGWWQCEQLGAEGFRADAAKPSCDWQGFTE
jgi:hypothetical protein